MRVRGDDRGVRQFALWWQAQVAWFQPEETMSPARRTPENDVGRYRQIESKPNRQNLQRDGHKPIIAQGSEVLSFA